MTNSASPAAKRPLIIVGDSAFAEVAHEYFDVDSDYEVIAFSVERDYLKQDTLRGLPVVAFEELGSHFAPASHSVFVAIPYAQLNRLRTRLAQAAKAKGFALASYISSRAFVWRNVTFGEHCFVFEDNTVQPFVSIGNNVILWSGNHIGHHSVVRDNCFVASHVVISGFCDIGENCFLGVNATIANNVSIGRDNWIGLGVTITRNTPENALYKGQRFEAASSGALEFFKVAQA